MSLKNMKIAIDCDDAAVALKSVIYEHLRSSGADICDLRYSDAHAADYPEIGYNLALKIRSKEYDRGILLCGTGLGMAIIANKVEGVYAGVCHDVYSAERLRKSNNAQIITMGARVIGPELAKMVVDAWLKSEFDEHRSGRKIKEIQMFEERSFHKENK
ncbi:MAG: RpiB/LacA/LacB family sugar-phosphate isomerase [Clostridia bacterium]|jgi:ribose 5-phosphate isomerase B